MTLRQLAIIFVLGWLTATAVHAQQAAPHINTIDAPTPQSGATIVINGTHFGHDKGILWISNGPAETTLWTDTRIVATIPATATSGTVWVARMGTPYIWSDGFQSLALPVPPVSANGITVHDVATYDDGLLQQLLDSDRSRLTGMQFLDQGKVAGNIGTVQGTSMQQSGLSFNIGGPPIAGVSSVLNSGNAVTTQSQGTTAQTNSASVTLTNNTGSGAAGAPSSELTVTSPTSSNTATTNNQTQATGPSTQTTYTLTQQNPVVPAAPPTTSFTAPSSFSPSASSILNEEVQLNSEVAGLALMMAGPLIDQVYPLVTPDGSVLYVQKHRVTLGIPITITPTEADKDAVAEVVLTISPSTLPPAADQLPQDGAPLITAILPQDKTYNTATISSKSVSLGGGVVTQVLTAGMNWLWQKQTYYIVQAQDTVAFQLPLDPTHPQNLSFGWDLKPVLGNRTVLAGNRTLFVQVAFTALSGEVPEYGRATVTTRWKKIDKKLNIVSPEAFDETALPASFSIKDFVPRPDVQDVEDPIDNGDGTVSVHLKSRYYTSSTYIKIGNSTLAPGAPNAIFSPRAIDFTVPEPLLGTQRGWLIDRTGKAEPSEIIVPLVGSDTNTECLDITGASATAESATSVLVTAALQLHKENDDCNTITNFQTDEPSDLHLIAVLGGKVFGYRDAPILFDDANDKISFHAPTDLIRTSPLLTVKRLFWGNALQDTYELTVPPLPVIDKATVVKKSKDNLEIALIGSNLTQLQAPPGMAFQKDGKSCTDTLSGVSDTNTGRMLCISGKLTTSLSQAPLTSTFGDLLLVALPSNSQPKSTGPTLQPQGYIDADVATNLTIRGTKLDGFDHVEIEGKKVAAELSADKKSILVHLTADSVKAPKIVLAFFFKDSANVSYTVNVNKKGG
jgi:hypothetical protein